MVKAELTTYLLYSSIKTVSKYYVLLNYNGVQRLWPDLLKTIRNPSELAEYDSSFIQSQSQVIF